MKTPVTDAAVAEYAIRIRAGNSTQDLFPTRMSDCDFTPFQREMIRQARADRKTAHKNGKIPALPPIQTNVVVKSQPTSTASPPKVIPLKTQTTHTLPKLARLLYLQSGRCFFCGDPLNEADASIEHLNPTSRGGTKSEDNEVVCHKSLNQVFGSMDLKHKFAFVLKSAGSFKCPKK